MRNNAGNKGAGGNERNNWRRNNIILVDLPIDVAEFEEKLGVGAESGDYRII
ncbi:hypothetical protein QQK_0451, partial [Clostridioides difficile P1]